MIKHQFTLTQWPISQMLVAMLVSLGFVSAGTLGYATNQLTIALNGYILLVVVGCEIAIWHFWKGFGREVHESQKALEQCTNKTPTFILGLTRNSLSPVFLCVLQDTLTKVRNGRGSDHTPILSAYETGLLRRPNLVNMLGCKCTPTLGMSSTVLGLLIVMMEIGHGLQSASDVKALTDAILLAVESLAMSFSTTATALIFGPLLVGVQVEHCRNALTQYIDQLDAILGSFNCGKLAVGKPNSDKNGEAL